MSSHFEAMVAAFSHTALSMTVADLREPDQPLVYCNGAFTALSGYPGDEVLGRNCRFLQGRDTDPAVVADLAAAVRAGRSHACVLLNYRRDGEPFLNELIVTPMPDEEGRLRYYLGVQRELGANETAGAAVPFRLRRNGRLDLVVEHVAPAVERMLGVGADQLVACDGLLLENVAAHDRDRLDRAFRLAAENERPFQIDVEADAGAGRQRWLRFQAKPLGPKNELRVKGTIADVTQQKLVKNRLDLFEAVTVHAQDVIIITEAAFVRPGPKIVYVNESFTRVTGYAAEEAIGNTPRMLQGADTKPESRAWLRQHFEQWRPVQATLRNYRRDGTAFWHELSITPIADSTGWYTHWISIQRDVTDRRRMQERVTFLAYHDPLTRLHNRAGCQERLETILKVAKAEAGRFSILQFDLDRFKTINDTLGHAAGDAVLQEVARRLERCVRSGDVVARTGGDEFVVVLPEAATREAAEAVARRIRSALMAPFHWNGHVVATGASIGLCVYPDDGLSVAELLMNADLALYSVKRAGNSDVAFYDRRMRDEMQAATALEDELRAALEQHEFLLHFQPQWLLDADRAFGAECLLRWRHPRRGLLAPAGFLDVAEDRGLLAAIQREVIGGALRALRAWRERGLVVGPLGINLTAVELADEGFAGAFVERLRAAGIDPADIAVEVVERVFLDGAAACIERNLHALHDAGVTIELDDFGTGFASLTHLREFPIDVVKIDRSFVKGIPEDRQDEKIVHAIIDLTHGLGMRVVAEGVESEAQIERLRAWGCDAVQGYLVARPMAEAALTDWLAAAAARRLTPTRSSLAASR